MKSDLNVDTLLLRLALTRPLDTYEWATASAAFVTWDGRTRCLFVRLQFGEGPTPALREPLQFPNLRFWEGPVPLGDALTALRQRDEAALTIDGCEVRLAKDFWQGHSPTSFFPAYLQPTPCFLAQTRLRNDPVDAALGFELVLREMTDEAPISRPGGPHFVDVLAATREWFHWSRKPDLGDSRFGSMQVVVPAPPGHVQSTTLRRDGKLLVELVPSLDPRRTAVWLTWEDDGEHRQEKGTSEDGAFVFPDCPQGPFTVYVHDNDSLAAYYRGHPYNIAAEPHVGLELEVLQLLRAGESETVEYKEAPSTRLSEFKGEFWNKLVKVIASFGNTQGGCLIIGATDEGELLGLDGQLRNPKPTAVGQDSKPLHVFLQKKLQDDLTYKPVVEMRWETVNDALVLIVRVQKNELGVVTGLRQGGNPIRKGSTSRLADSDECQELFGQRPPR